MKHAASGSLLAAIATIATLTSFGCEGTETGNPVIAELRLHAHSSRPAEVAVGDDASLARVDGVWLAAGRVELLGQDCGPAVTASGPVDEDLAQATFEAVLELEAQPVCGARLVLDPAAAPAGAPAELDGGTVLVLGERADGTPVVLRSERALPVELAPVAGPFELDLEAPGLFLGFDVARWLIDLDLAGATVNEDGVIVVDLDADPARGAAFEAALARGVELYRDVNGNGAVDGPDDVLLAIGGDD
jgi:hypothetical protein